MQTSYKVHLQSVFVVWLSLALPIRAWRWEIVWSAWYVAIFNELRGSFNELRGSFKDFFESNSKSRTTVNNFDGIRGLPDVFDDATRPTDLFNDSEGKPAKVGACCRPTSCSSARARFSNRTTASRVFAVAETGDGSGRTKGPNSKLHFQKTPYFIWNWNFKVYLQFQRN